VLLLIDDKAGRDAAKKLNIPVTGLIGVLIAAKANGLLANVGQAIEELRNNGYWLSNEVMHVAKRLSGEEQQVSLRLHLWIILLKERRIEEPGGCSSRL
jgi:predicted nucleic acid-binding protein